MPSNTTATSDAPRFPRKWLLYASLVAAIVTAGVALVFTQARQDVVEHFRHGKYPAPTEYRFRGVSFSRDSWIVLRFDVSPVQLEIIESFRDETRPLATVHEVDWGVRQWDVVDIGVYPLDD